MNAAILALLSFVAYILAYRFYSRWLSVKIFGLDPDFRTPAHEFEDGKDHVPTNKHVLFGHHFTSIAGAAPIVGPALAVIWGWLPAVLWVVFGSIFMGAVHDFGCLVISAKNKGKSIADLTGIIITPRARVLFLTLVLLLTWLVLAVFAFVIGKLFQAFPGSVFPINFEIIVALAIGVLFYKYKVRILWPSIVALVLLYGAVVVGAEWGANWKLPDNVFGLGLSGIECWVIFLLTYSFVACMLPVWLLLQPRDYINSHQLFVGLGILYLGLLLMHPVMPAGSALHLEVEGHPIFPFLFVTIACGAISGFHGLVGSGTTSKQLDKLPDARFIGYGATIGEGLLALMSVLACTAGYFAFNGDDWHNHYSSWANADKNSLKAFVIGGAEFFDKGLGPLASLLPEGFSKTLLAVIAISFAATTLDTACRIQRYIIAELGATLKLKVLENGLVGSAIAAFSPLLLIFLKTTPAPGQTAGAPYFTRIWPIFGACNQMLAALSLLVLSIWLARKGKNYWVTLLPFLFIAVITATAMTLNLREFFTETPRNNLLLAVSAVLLGLSVWIIIEGVVTFLHLKRNTLQSDSIG